MLDSGARAATSTFAHRKLGDVLLAWENEAFLLVQELGRDQFEIIVPSVSILAEPPVAVVDANVEKHNTRAVAQGYLEFLYTLEGQRLAARHHFRPRSAQVAEEYSKAFPPITLFTVTEVFKGWTHAQARHFDDGGEFDQMYQGAR